MPLYSYSAKNFDGQVVSGTYEVSSYEELKKTMYEKGYFLTKASVTRREVSFKKFNKKIKLKDFTVFCRQFAVILSSGLTVIEAIAILIQQTQNKKLKEVLANVYEEVLKGTLLSNALGGNKEVFPEFFINMVKVGEASGSLDLVLNRLADYYEKENKIKKKVKAALTYPIIVVIVATLVISLLMLKVLPNFASILQSMGGQLPLVTVVLMAISNFMVKNIIYITAINILLIISLILYVKTEGGKYNLDKLKLKVPIVKNIVIKVITSKFARSMSMLLKSGIPIINAMEIMAELIGNKVVEEKFRVSSTEIKEGKGIATSLKKMYIFPPLLTNMVSVGENTGELDDMLSRTSDFFDDEVEEAVEQMTTMIEPIMIIFLAVVVGTIVLAVMLPMVNIMESIK